MTEAEASVEAVGAPRDRLLRKVERFDRRPIEPFELFTSEFGQNNSVRIQENSSKTFRNFLKFEKFSSNSQHFLKYSAKFREIFVRIGAKFDEKVLKTNDFTEIQAKFWKKFDEFLLKFWDLSGAKDCKSCRSRKTLQNDYLVAIVAVDTAENEPYKV